MPTSVAGRFQFSTENAYSVRTLNAEASRGLDGVAHGVDAGAVSFDARQMALRGPAAVAVHDDGDVRGQPIELNLAGQRRVGVSGRNPRQEVVKRHGVVLVDASS